MTERYRDAEGLARAWRKFARCRSGASAVEFVMISPVLLLMLLGGADLGRYIIATQRVEAVANSIGEMLAETPANNTATDAGDGVVSGNDLLFYYNSAMFTFPQALADANAQGVNWWSILSVQIASVKFVPTPSTCTSNCSYTAKVVWTLGGARACGSTITSTPDTSAYNPATLPSDIFAAGSKIVVDVSYAWKPTIGAAYLPSVTIERSVFVSPRYVPVVEANAPGVATSCPNVL